MAESRKTSLRALALQILLALAVAGLVYLAAGNAAQKLAKQGIVAGFGFLSRNAGFDIGQRLIPYAAATSTYLDAFLVGLCNTLLAAALGIVLATLNGFVVGIARLSPNLLARGLASAYVEAVRNVPLLLQLLVWYVAVRVALPSAEAPASLGGVFVSQRGLVLPSPEFSGAAWLVPIALLAGIAALSLLRRRARRAAETGRPPVRAWLPGLALTILLPGLAWIGLALAGHPVAVDWPARGRYDVEGGLPILPEFAALVLGLSTYTAAFIAEIVRAGLSSVARGQGEAAAALGLSRGQALRLVVIPQAMRAIVPPLTSQYLNVTKNSSLAIAIGFPDLVSVFMNTSLNQSGRAIPIVAMTMGFYCLVSLAVSLAMNRYNRSILIRER